MKNVIIARHINSSRKDVYFWTYKEEEHAEQYDYAIVECANNIGLVKIIGIGQLNDDEKLGHKKVLKFITSADWAGNERL